LPPRLDIHSPRPPLGFGVTAVFRRRKELLGFWGLQ
jgi:hypothetical protein